MSEQAGGGTAVAEPPAPTPAGPGPVGQGPYVRLPVAVLAVLAAVVVALLAVALAVRLDTDRLPTGPPRDPPPAPPEATTFFVQGLRKVSYEEFSVTLAGAPYGCGDAQQVPTGFLAAQGCSLAVHPDFDAAGHDWAAVTGVLLVGDGLVTPGNVSATTTKVFDALVPQLYSADDHYTLSKVSADTGLPTAPAGRSAGRSADVDVRAKGLATPYDRLVVVVVQLASGRCVAFFSDFPHDAGQAALDAVTASANTISLRR